MSCLDAINKVSADNNLPEDLTRKIYFTYWKYIRESVQNLQIKDVDIADDTTLNTSFNIPSLGKLYTTFDKINTIKRVFNNAKDKKD